MPALVTLLMFAAFVSFAIPAIRAILGRTFDYTNSGLACLTLALMLG